jgi:predicted transcriptional regulator
MVKRIITLSVDKLEKIKSDIEQVISEHTKLPTSITKYQEIITEQYDLTEKERDVFDYIRKNPSTTKQELVNNLDKYSRATIFKVLKDLEYYGMIIVRLDVNNSQIHHLFINDDSLLVSVVNGLDDFEKVYFTLLKKLNDKFDKKYSNQKTPKGEKTDKRFVLLYDLYSVYERLIRMYLIYALAIWPKKTSNNDMIRRLYIILFTRLSKMQFNLLTTFPAMLSQYPVLENMVLDSSIEAQRKQSIHECCDKYELGNEAENMLCVVDKMHSDLMTFVFPANDKKNLGRFTDKHVFIEGRAFAKVIPRRKTVKESLSLS